MPDDLRMKISNRVVRRFVRCLLCPAVTHFRLCFSCIIVNLISIINICAYIIVTALRKTNDNPFVPPPHLNYRLGKVECGETLVCLFSRNLMCIKFHQQHEGFGSQAHFILNQNDYHYFLKRHKQTICSVVSYCLGEMVMVNFFVFNIESAHQQRNGLILN